MTPDPHLRALAVVRRLLDETDPIRKADLNTSLCDLRAASSARRVDPAHIHPITGLDYSPEAYKRALASGADPDHLDQLWKAFKEQP